MQVMRIIIQSDFKILLKNNLDIFKTIRANNIKPRCRISVPWKKINRTDLVNWWDVKLQRTSASILQ